MRVLAYRGVNDPEPIVKQCDVVVLTQDDGTPVLVAHRVAEGRVLLADFRDPSFASLLAQLGIHQTVIPEDQSRFLISPERLPKLR